MDDSTARFVAAIEGAGLPAPSNLIDDGVLHRFSTNGKPGDDSGWYVLHLDGVPAGAFGCWRTGVISTWCAKVHSDLTEIERRENRRRMEAAQKQRDADKQRRNADAAIRATEIWASTELAPEHPYLDHKGIQGPVRVVNDVIVIPMYDIDEKLCSLQFIDRDGEKRFLPGGKVSGSFFSFGTIKDVIFLCEGYATGASIYEAMGETVIVAFNAGNLMPVAKLMRERYPDIRLVIAADNDIRSDGTDNNTGVEKATEAVVAVNGLLVVPELGGAKCDFNDVHQQYELEILRQQLAGARKSEQQEFEEQLRELIKLDPVRRHKRTKKFAEELGVPVGVVKESVEDLKRAKAVAEEQAIVDELFPRVEPTIEIIDGNELLGAISAQIKRYIVLSEHQLTATTLWVLLTYTVEVVYIAPLLAIQSPQKRCGKSNLMIVLQTLIHRGLLVNSLSMATVYRVMDLYHPTLLIDEADAFLDEQEELRGIINGGHCRATSKTLRVGGANRDKVEIFDSFGPKAIAGIGRRKDTIADRSIVLNLRRRRADEMVEILRQDRLDYKVLHSHCAAWATQNMAALKSADPTVPKSLHDRAQDNWRSMLAIADLTGWGDKARKAAEILTESDTDSETVGVMVLEDIQKLFTDRGVDRLASADIVDALHELEHRPWPEWGRSRKPISQRQLARLLEPFRIKPKQLRVTSEKVRGYELGQFRDTFSRYLPNTVVPSGIPVQPNGGAGFSDFLSGTGDSGVPDGNPLKPLQGNGCTGVPDENAPEAGKQEKTDDNPPVEYI